MDGQRRESLWRAIAGAIGTPGQGSWAEDVCHICVEMLAGIDAAALTLRATPRAQDMLGASEAWAAYLDDEQYTLGEGPGMAAFASGSPVLIGDIRVDEARWPGFSDAALSVGAAAVFAFPLQIGGIRLGTIDLYRRRTGGLPAHSVADALVLTDLITLAMLEEADRAELAGEEWIRAAGSYQDVNIATGMLAAQMQLSLDDAFVRLRAHAFTTERPVLDVARDVLAQRIDVNELPE